VSREKALFGTLDLGEKFKGSGKAAFAFIKERGQFRHRFEPVAGAIEGYLPVRRD